MRFRYSAARWAGVHFVCILIASRLLRGAEGLSVGLKRPGLSGPLVKQRWIVLQLQQCGSNMLGFWHFFFSGIKAGFFVFRVVARRKGWRLPATLGKVMI